MGSAEDGVCAWEIRIHSLVWQLSIESLHPALTLGEWIYSALHPCMLSCFSCVQLFVTLWTVARQSPLSIGFSRQQYWSGLPFPSPDWTLFSCSFCIAGGFFTTESLGKPHTHAHKLSSEIQGTDLWLPEMGFVGEMDKDSQKLQASSYKINKTWAWWIKLVIILYYIF